MRAMIQVGVWIKITLYRLEVLYIIHGGIQFRIRILGIFWNFKHVPLNPIQIWAKSHGGIDFISDSILCQIQLY